MSIILPSFAGIVGPISSGGGGVQDWNGNTYALSLDGTNDYVALADSNDFSFGDGSSNSAFSYSFWVRVERASTNGFQHLISKGSSNTSEYLIQHMPPNSYGLNANSIYFAIYPGSTSVVAVVESPANSINTNTWYHVVCTADGTGNRSGMKIYIDGVSQTLRTTGSSSLTMINSTSALHFGARSQSTPDSYLQGKMDEIALFNSELSASDITSIYNSGAPGDISSLNPVGWWRMGDNNSGSGTTITDQGSGGNDATLVNGPTFSTDVPVAPSFNNSGSLSYDGTDDYALASSLSGHAAPFTMSFWFYTTNDAVMVPFHYQDNLWFRMVLRSSSDGRRIRFYGSNESNKTSTGGWVSGQWNHFAATVDSSGNTDLYLNGTYDSTHTEGGISAVTSNFMIGAQWYNGSPISEFNGQLDEIATWNAVLSNGSASVGATAGGDIAAIYNSGAPNDLASAGSYDTDRTSNLTNWWRMEEGSGTSVANAVSGGTALTLYNDTTFSTNVPS
jgi:hypothetical protein